MIIWIIMENLPKDILRNICKFLDGKDMIQLLQVLYGSKSIDKNIWRMNNMPYWLCSKIYESDRIKRENIDKEDAIYYFECLSNILFNEEKKSREMIESKWLNNKYVLSGHIFKYFLRDLSEIKKDKLCLYSKHCHLCEKKDGVPVCYDKKEYKRKIMPFGLILRLKRSAYSAYALVY